MGNAKPAEPVKLFCGILAAPQVDLATGAGRVAA
jgi:hypothetical protein